MKATLISLSILCNLAYAHGGKLEGGISGGGGNVINPTPPKTYQDPREVKAIIKGSRFLLYNFINAKYALYLKGSMDYESLKLYSVLFADNEDNLHEVMEDIKMNIKTDDSCYDQAGTAYDGSTYDRKEHSICISAYRIAKNTDKYEVPVQAAALILHEYSEVVGLSDDDAIILQKQVIEELKNW